MTVPFTAVQFSAYESLKGLMNPAGTYSPLTHIVAGGVAGGLAAAVTTPLDVAKVSYLCPCGFRILNRAECEREKMLLLSETR